MGVTVLATAVATVPTALSTAPVPLAKTAVREVLSPAVRVAFAAEKLVMVGAGTTVTVVWRVVAVPAALVTVRV